MRTTVVNKKIIRVFFGIIFFIGSLFIGTAGNATESNGGFSFEVIRPENQINPEVTYFDLLMNPGQKQTIKIKMNNDTDKEMKVSLKLNGAKTNSNGVVEYGPSQIKEDASVKYKFTDVVKAPEKITLDPNSSETVGIDISMPETSIEGYLAGGIQLQEVTDEGVESESNQGMVINKFAYLVGILLSESDTSGLAPDLSLNKVYPGLNNYSNSIFVNFSNVMPVYVDDMTVDVQIMKKKSDEVLYDSKKANMRMAPNTFIDFPISLNGEKMVAGNYRAKIVITTKNGGRWSWEEAFTIKDEEADKFNDQDLSLVQENGNGWKWMALIVAILLLLFLFVYLIIYFIRKKKTEKERELRKVKTKKRQSKD